MINVFISRPTWIDEPFKQGLNGFLQYIETLELKPRTLGSPDSPLQSPLDEVIKIMEECKGIIVLGYPQIEINSGKIKDKIISNIIVLPTEWNHIEAGLAYAKKLPMLIIHHSGVSRGIFDKGAMNKYLYEKDLTDNGWVLSGDIVGAIKKWKEEILKSDSASNNNKIANSIKSKNIIDSSDLPKGRSHFRR